MVRFIIMKNYEKSVFLNKFTFQYGQIYYYTHKQAIEYVKEIYIPIWLDLLQVFVRLLFRQILDLHSNMVRFIIFTLKLLKLGFIVFTFQYGQIYYTKHCVFEYDDLSEFTFQYGQIYYFILFVVKLAFNNIYIPIWLDLLLSFLSIYPITSL